VRLAVHLSSLKRNAYPSFSLQTHTLPDGRDRFRSVLMDVMHLSPRRPWTGADNSFEDSIMETFMLFCSHHFITWGSV
jgi:hypothetical protein